MPIRRWGFHPWLQRLGGGYRPARASDPGPSPKQPSTPLAWSTPVGPAGWVIDGRRFVVSEIEDDVFVRL